MKIFELSHAEKPNYLIHTQHKLFLILVAQAVDFSRCNIEASIFKDFDGTALYPRINMHFQHS